LRLGHRFKGMQRFLGRHSRTLEELQVLMGSIYQGQVNLRFDEALPTDLPQLQVLALQCVGCHALESLGRCSLPLLRELSLEVDVELDPRSVVLEDLKWIAEVAALERVRLVLNVGNRDAGVVEQLRGLLAARPWVQVALVAWM
jgi:hypothetical protein